MPMIRVHACEVCNEHAKEQGNGPGESRVYEVEGIHLSECRACGILRCVSCACDGWCCQKKADDEALAAKKKECLFEV